MAPWRRRPSSRWSARRRPSAAGFRTPTTRPPDGAWAVISHAYWHAAVQLGGADTVLRQCSPSTASRFQSSAWRPPDTRKRGGPDVWVPLGLVGGLDKPRQQFSAVVWPAARGHDARLVTRDVAGRVGARCSATIPRRRTDSRRGLFMKWSRKTASQGLWVLLAARPACCCDRLRERRQSPAGALGGPRARPGRARVARRGRCACSARWRRRRWPSACWVIAARITGAGLPAVRLFVALAPGSFPRIDVIAIDWRVLLLLRSVAVFTALVAGIAPAMHLLRANLNDVTRAGGGRSLTSGRARLASRALVVLEMSVAVARYGCGGAAGQERGCGWNRRTLALRGRRCYVQRGPAAADGARGNDTAIRLHDGIPDAGSCDSRRDARVSGHQPAADRTRPAPTDRCGERTRRRTPRACQSPSTAP